MTVSNQHKRRSAMALGNVIATDPKLRDLSMEQLKEKVENDDPEVIGKLLYYSKNLPGSDQFFFDLSTKCQKFQEYLRYKSNDTQMFSLFQTFSYADMHWRGLHELFPESVEYLDKIVSQFFYLKLLTFS